MSTPPERPCCDCGKNIHIEYAVGEALDVTGFYHLTWYTTAYHLCKKCFKKRLTKLINKWPE